MSARARITQTSASSGSKSTARTVRQRQIRRHMQRQQNPTAIVVRSRTLESRKLIGCQRDIEMPDSVSQDDFLMCKFFKQ